MLARSTKVEMKTGSGGSGFASGLGGAQVTVCEAVVAMESGVFFDCVLDTWPTYAARQQWLLCRVNGGWGGAAAAVVVVVAVIAHMVVTGEGLMTQRTGWSGRIQDEHEDEDKDDDDADDGVVVVTEQGGRDMAKQMGMWRQEEKEKEGTRGSGSTD
ncbi:hypothetical protein HK104_003603 [Borealophlyctis nickersoniae]|nr:hypothetical protein HK104_003603 [Borealophlyctis nickersoniae]